MTFTSLGAPGAPDSYSQLSPAPPASVGCGLRARRAPTTSRAPWTAHPAARRPLNRTRVRVLLAQPSHCSLLSRLSPSRPVSLLPAVADSSGCGPETFLPALSELGTIVVICDCPLIRGTQTQWTGFPRREARSSPRQERHWAAGLGGCQGAEPTPR